MPRKTKTPKAAEPVVQPTVEMDEFDRAIAAREATYPAVTPLHVPPEGYDLASPAHRAAEAAHEAIVPREAAKAPRRDPVPIARIALSADAGGPVVRLWRNNSKGVMAITFDEKPAPEHTNALKEAGFRWQPEPKAWTLPMDPDRKWAAHIDAQRAFFAVGNAIRQDQGLEPVQGVAV